MSRLVGEPPCETGKLAQVRQRLVVQVGRKQLALALDEGGKLK
jgi:hypothetical protein